MVEVGKVYEEPVEVHSQLRLVRHWLVLYKVSDELCFVTNEEGKYEIKNPSKWKVGKTLVERKKDLDEIMNRYRKP